MLTHGMRWVVAMGVSIAAAVMAATWLTAPGTYPYGSDDVVRAGINVFIEREAAATMLLTAAVLGAALAGIGLRLGTSRTWTRIAGVGACLEVAFFGFVMADSSVMAALGYAVALAAPLAALIGLALACRAWRPLGFVLVPLVAALGALGYVTGILGDAADTAATYLSNLGTGAGDYSLRIAWALGMAGAAGCWAWAAVGSLRSGVPSWTPSASAMRWGRIATIVAALCPVPYGLARLSWLTPWRFGDVDPADPDTIILWNSNPAKLEAVAVIQGGLFALAVGVGVLLTLGLIRPWGETFPRWFPIVGRRPVPIALAVVPGLVVAAVITLSASGFVMSSVEGHGPYQIALSLFFLPFPLWGVALTGAVLAYWLRRTGGRSPAPTRLEPSNA